MADAVATIRSLVGEKASREHKRLVNLQAEFARRGFTLDPLIETKVLVRRWGLSRVLDDLDAAERFLKLLGGAF